MANQPTFKYALLLLDVLILSAAYVAAAGWTMPPETPALPLAMLFVVLLVTSLLLFRLNDLYKRHVVVTRYRQLMRLAKSLLLATALASVLLAFVSFPFFRAEGLQLVLTAFAFALASFVVLRVIPAKSVMLFLSRRNIYRSNLLIVGGGAAARHVEESLRSDEIGGFNVVGFVDDGGANAGVPPKPFVGCLEELGRLVVATRADEILIAVDDTRYDRLVHIVERCLKTGKVVRIYSKVLDVIARKLNVEFYSAVPVIMLSEQSRRSRYARVKRSLDVTLAAIGLVVLSPIFLIVAIGIWLSSKGPIFFRQQRIGKGGVPFNFFKFRSMHVNTDDSQHKDYVTQFIASGRATNDDAIKIFKIQNDPRIFPFGRFIRKASLDEFPQLYNVLRGEMSLVGPRPCLPYEWECYEEWHRRRLQDLPGCTGLWQALGRSTVTFDEMVVLDLYYLSNASLWLDLKIVLHTLPVILFGRGAF